jgi:hypothetical protein
LRSSCSAAATVRRAGLADALLGYLVTLALDLRHAPPDANGFT